MGTFLALNKITCSIVVQHITSRTITVTATLNCLRASIPKVFVCKILFSRFFTLHCSIFFIIIAVKNQGCRRTTNFLWQSKHSFFYYYSLGSLDFLLQWNLRSPHLVNRMGFLRIHNKHIIYYLYLRRCSCSCSYVLCRYIVVGILLEWYGKKASSINAVARGEVKILWY